MKLNIYSREIILVSAPIKYYAPIRLSVGLWRSRNKWLAGRFNGCNGVDGKKSQFPGDGHHQWLRGTVRGDFVYGCKEAEGAYLYEVCYYPGPRDLAWVAECDCSYLLRLLWGATRQIIPGAEPDTTELCHQEPGVWYLWRQAGAPNDIGAWWLTQLRIPNLPLLVARARELYRREQEYSRERRFTC